ncbi:MAG: sigma-70 family RNA polymerase sigma factor [Candidatus Poribacteria bacterium]|nr:sigma-70 family RNA polymerase sigma factor [Candidatus Poribacteria bacterium]
MKQENDAQLIDDILSGDTAAFNTLVERYQKSVHALVWRKIGDFHYAEEVTQDTFLQAYKKLSTLKKPNLFAGWLYVIANRLSIKWLREQKPVPQSLETIPVNEIEESSYTRYVSEQHDINTTEHRRELVQKLLEKLPDSERTVMTLYYLSEMTTKEIGKFLGVSVHTITSRLQRARKRLQRDEERLVQEVLSGVQVSARLSENIMREVADIKTTSPPVSKPLLPWAAFGTAAVLIVLLLGTSNRYLARFQKPYSFEAQSEPTIEIIDTLVTFDIDSKPDVRNQIGEAMFPGKSNSTGLQTSEMSPAATVGVDAAKFSTSRWRQVSGPQKGPAYGIFTTPERTLHVSTQTGIYRLPTGETAWGRINANPSINRGYISMAAYRDTLYIASTDEIFTSSDDGETWHTFCPRPRGRAVGLVITDAPQSSLSPTTITMYLALRGKGVFQSTDAGTEWNLLDKGLRNRRIYRIAAIENTVFVGTDEGLYRLNAGVWEELPVGTSKTTQSLENFEDKTPANTDSGFYRLRSGIWEQVPIESVNAIHSLAVSEDDLYVGMGPDLSMWAKSTKSELAELGVIVDVNSVQGRIFHSADFGESWTEITPKDKPLFFTVLTGIKLLVAGETLLVQGVEQFRSTDAGRTWTQLDTAPVLSRLDLRRIIAADEKVSYTIGGNGIYRTTDTGDSWHLFMEGIIGTGIRSLVAFNNRLCAYTGRDIVQSTDGGESWKRIPVDADDTFMLSYGSKLRVRDGNLYGIASEVKNFRIFGLSADGNTLVPTEKIPDFDEEMLSTESWTTLAAAEQVHLPDDLEENPQLTKTLRNMTTFARVGGFAVSGETFYVEYLRRLFKWKLGDPEWTDTGLIDLTQKSAWGQGGYGFRLAASGEIVYVGKRDGKLLQSFDGGNSWRDITLILPLRFTYFKEIVFAGPMVYIATDTGVLASQNGEHWRVLTDGMGQRRVIDKFAVDGTAVYGAGNAGVYRLGNRGKWEQVSPSVPGKIISLAINNGRLYVVTGRRGLFHISLDEKFHNASINE